MANMHEVGENVAKGFQSHDQAFIGKVAEDIGSWNKDGRHSQAQIDKSMQELTQDLHQRKVLPDLTIIGADAKNHELIAQDANKRTVLIDAAGNRSDSAQQMAHKMADSINTSGVFDASSQTAARENFAEANRMMDQTKLQMSSAAAKYFDSQVTNFYGKEVGHQFSPVVLIPQGQNMAHGANAVR